MEFSRSRAHGAFAVTLVALSVGCGGDPAGPSNQTTTFALTIVQAGSGAGTVTSSPAGIECGGDCEESYDQGTSVTLAATPATGSTFTGWSGGGCSGTESCVVSVTGAATVTATFALTTHVLNVALAGSGGGTVASSPAGIECGGDCDESYDYGTSVTLAATPATGSTFAGWSGGGCSGTASCVVSMTGDAAVIATFDVQTFSVGGTVSGLFGVGCTLQLNGGSDLVLSGNGDFTFAAALPYGADYTVTVASQPVGPTQTCVLSNASGIVTQAVTDVAVNCTTDSPGCDTAVYLGSIAADTGFGSVNASGAGSAWYRVRLTEDSSASVSLRAAVTLAVPTGIDYDLYVYCAACGGAPAGSSVEAAGSDERIEVSIGDDLAGDDSGDLLVEVRYVSGQSPTSWALQVAGNVTVTTPVVCNF